MPSRTSPVRLFMYRTTSEGRIAASFTSGPKNGLKCFSTIPFCRMYSSCEILPFATFALMRFSWYFKNSPAKASNESSLGSGRPNLIASSTLCFSARVRL